MRKILFTTFITLIISLISCNNNNTTPQQQNSEKEGETSLTMPDFDADSAFTFVKAQTDFGPRTPGSDAHKACALWLSEKLGSYCDTVILQQFTSKTYDNKSWESVNIIGEIAPEKTNRILLAAHWDSRPFADHDPNPANHDKPIDGANDGASGVGVLLEIARQLHLQQPEVGVDIILFDLEDYGTPQSVDLPGDWWCLGAQYWAKNPHKTGYKADFGILLDMVGASNAVFRHEAFSYNYAQPYLAKIWGTAYQLGHKEYFRNEAANPITDDHLYVNTIARIPMVNIVHQDNSTGTGFTTTWHTLNDNINNIDPKTLKVVGTTVLAVIKNHK